MSGPHPSGHPGPSRRLRLLFLGFGNVGQELARLLLARRHWLAGRGLDLPVTGIVSRRHGLLADPKGLDLEQALAWAAPAGAAGGARLDLPALLRDFPADVVVEMTSLRVDLRGEPATSHVRAALAAGKHVVSANKGPVAWAWPELDALARRTGRRFLFEAAVMDGAPVFSLARYTLPGCRITGVRGILNTTTNYVLGRMGAGLSLAEAVREAQAGGFAESDPSLDLEGWDAAVKLTCLARVLMGSNFVPEEVERTGISGLTPGDLERETHRGRVLKLVAEAGPGDPPRVGPLALPPDDILALVSGTSSALTLHTDLMGAITVFEHEPQLPQTAYGVFRDLLEVAGGTAGDSDPSLAMANCGAARSGEARPGLGKRGAV